MDETSQDLRARYEELAGAFGPAISASVASARLDEASRRLSVRKARLARHEAIALANREGLGCDEIRLLAHLSGGAEDVVSKVERTAADLMRAHARAAALVPGRSEPIDLVEVWNLSESWNPRSPDADGSHEHGIDRDAETLTRLLDGLAADPSPIEGADLVARIVRDRLFPQPDRMAGLVGPAIMRTALAAPGANFGLARWLPAPDTLATMPSGEAQRAVLKAVRSGAAAAQEDLESAGSLRTDLAYKVAGERAGSRTGEAIDAFIETPLLGIVALQGIVGLTHKGANMMIRRLVGAGIVRPHRSNRAKGRLFVCDRALARPS